jgi:putative phosphoesterase
MVATDAFSAASIAVLADCHIHPGGGPDWTDAVLQALIGVDLIVTLGDMGEAAGLDRLSRFAPVIGVTGADDEPDPRTAGSLRRLDIGGLSLGCVFDAQAAGLAQSNDPFTPAKDWTGALASAFGGPVDALLYASTHRPAATAIAGCWAINPGSALLPAEGATASFARLGFEGGRLACEFVTLS